MLDYDFEEKHRTYFEKRRTYFETRRTYFETRRTYFEKRRAYFETRRTYFEKPRVQAGACSAEKNEFACRSFHRTSYLVALPAPGAAAMPPFHTHVVPPCPSQQVLIDLVGVVHVIVAVLFERSLPLSPHTPRMHAPPPPPLAPPDRF
ncbi:unnamed protein product [Closterium sp. NIES-53]